MAWWDYGYHIRTMADRAVMVDNSAANATQIAAVARAFVLPEASAAEYLRAVGVDHVLVHFGGMSGYASDDVNKMGWMVSIGEC